jgi:hypothetical protein
MFVSREVRWIDAHRNEVLFQVAAGVVFEPSLWVEFICVVPEEFFAVVEDPGVDAENCLLYASQKSEEKKERKKERKKQTGAAGMKDRC